MIAVSNSTPLIALAKVNRLDLLRDYFGEIYIPEEVPDQGRLPARAPWHCQECWNVSSENLLLTQDYQEPSHLLSSPLIGTLPSLWLDFCRSAIAIEDTNRLISLVEL